MEWGKLYANLYHQPAVQAAEDTVDGAGWLLTCSMMYCTEAETGGFVPDTQIRRFGLANLDAKVKALADEECWLREDRGYRLNPGLWSEERNLSDSAERKREADRLRMRARRAAERGEPAPEASRDSSATGRATPSGDSRTQSRGEKNKPPPTPRRRPAAPPGPPLMNLAATPGGGESSLEQPEDPATILVAEVRGQRPEWSETRIRRALTEVSARPWPSARRAMLAVAADRSSEGPWRVTQDGPWWHQPPTPATSSTLPGQPDGHPADCACLGSMWIDDPEHLSKVTRCPGYRPDARRSA